MPGDEVPTTPLLPVATQLAGVSISEMSVTPDAADFTNWKFGRRFDRSLTRRFPWQDDSGSRLS